MKKSISFMVLASLAFAAPAFAKNDEQREERIIIKKHFDGAFEDFDANKDGKVSKKEFEKGSKSRSQDRFKELDKNGDGYLSDEERSHRVVRHMRGPRIEIDIEGMNAEVDAALAQVDEELARVQIEIEKAMKEHDNVRVYNRTDRRALHMDNMDENADGKISRDEYLKSRNDQFAEIDTNNDGFVSEDELANFKPRHMERRWIIKKDEDE